MRKLASIAIVMILVFSTSVFAEENKNDNFFISPELGAAEREIIGDIMQTLPESDRENVIYFAPDGEVYANKPELKENVEKAEYVGDGVYAWENGETFVLPEAQAEDQSQAFVSDISILNYSCSGNTGPYRRVFSNPGYSYYEGRVYLPAAAEVNDQSQPGGNSTSYIYTGGRNGTEVDAGFQYGKTNQDWAFFNSPAGQGRTSGSRYKSGQTVTLKFYVTQDNQVAVSTTGIKMNSTTVTTETLVANAPGWKLNGTGNILKRITSIGQIGGNNFNSGAYLRNVQWSSSKIGTTAANAQQCLQAKQAVTAPFRIAQ